MTDTPEPRKVMPDVRLDELEFKRRFKSQYTDPVFDRLSSEVERVAQAAWESYSCGRKSPRTAKAGKDFEDPNYDVAVDWIRTRGAIAAAQLRHDDPNGPSHFLLINGSCRSEHTCPGESSKSWRLVELARQVIERQARTEVTVLDLSHLASEYGRHIHPCKCCFSTAAALCHWPCSCYPNYSLGQTQDWMNEIYPMWVAAHGILIVTPVNWYYGSSALKLMMDRLVCADGGNTDPTSTQGKDAQKAKKLELQGWNYRRHLQGRIFGCIVHGDAEGAEGARRSLCDWMKSLDLLEAGSAALIDRYIGYWQPYALSHRALDQDAAIQQETRNAAATLVEAVQDVRAGRRHIAGNQLDAPRDK
jgi:multimeric flavodoxin WrbA